MKTSCWLALVSMVAFTGCSARYLAGGTKPSPETVLITYHAKPGMEANLQAVLAQAWQIYQAGHLVLAGPHTLIRETEDQDKTRYVEIFSWVSQAVPEHAPDAVQKIWAQEQTLCEARNGHRGIEGGEVELLTGTAK
jgi:hypothetical protein